MLIESNIENTEKYTEESLRIELEGLICLRQGSKDFGITSIQEVIMDPKSLRELSCAKIHSP